MEPITFEQLQKVLDLTDRRFRRWNVRGCSICNSKIGYAFQDGEIGFDARCDCSSGGEIQPRSRNDLLSIFNDQTPEGRKLLWDDFLKAMDYESRLYLDNDRQIIAKAREVAPILLMPPDARYGPSDVGDVLVQYLRGEKPFEDAMEALNYLAIDYVEENKRRSKPVGETV